MLDPAPGERVADLCAAPGGKTTHIAALMRGSGTLLAVERSRARADALREFVKQAGAASVTKVVCGDGAALGTLAPDGSFDRVLVDAPCSGLGLRPRLTESISVVDVAAKPHEQLRLAREAARIVRIGGTVVYSCCTMNPLEGEGIVASVLSDPSLGLSLVSQDRWHVAGPGLAGMGLSEEQRSLVQRFYVPSSAPEEVEGDLWQAALRDTSAFFVAKFVKQPTKSETKE